MKGKMSTTGAQTKTSAAAAPPVPVNPTGARNLISARETTEPAPSKPAGYGLPCTQCRLYYPADLDICPTCHHHERVSPVVPTPPRKSAEKLPDPAPDSAAVEQEREEFLRQFKSKLIEVHSEVVNAHGSFCALAGHHDGEESGAEICRACYERMQERMDVFEGAFQIDLKEAAQIIYDAVWSDPSDPSKTYENAAAALLIELRKRAGISPPVGPFHPISD